MADNRDFRPAGTRDIAASRAAAREQAEAAKRLIVARLDEETFARVRSERVLPLPPPKTS